MASRQTVQANRQAGGAEKATSYSCGGTTWQRRGAGVKGKGGHSAAEGSSGRAQASQRRHAGDGAAKQESRARVSECVCVCGVQCSVQCSVQRQRAACRAAHLQEQWHRPRRQGMSIAVAVAVAVVAALTVTPAFQHTSPPSIERRAAAALYRCRASPPTPSSSPLADRLP
jgi:hypothetical protein